MVAIALGEETMVVGREGVGSGSRHRLREAVGEVATHLSPGMVLVTSAETLTRASARGEATNPKSAETLALLTAVLAKAVRELQLVTGIGIRKVGPGLQGPQGREEGLVVSGALGRGRAWGVGGAAGEEERLLEGGMQVPPMDIMGEEARGEREYTEKLAKETELWKEARQQRMVRATQENVRVSRKEEICVGE